MVNLNIFIKHSTSGATAARNQYSGRLGLSMNSTFCLGALLPQLPLLGVVGFDYLGTLRMIEFLTGNAINLIFLVALSTPKLKQGDKLCDLLYQEMPINVLL